MEDTNPQGSAQTVDNAAAKIFGMLEPEQPEGQAEELAQEETEQVEVQAYEEAEGEEVQEEVEAAIQSSDRVICHVVSDYRRAAC